MIPCYAPGVLANGTVEVNCGSLGTTLRTVWLVGWLVRRSVALLQLPLDRAPPKQNNGHHISDSFHPIHFMDHIMSHDTTQNISLSAFNTMMWSVGGE